MNELQTRLSESIPGRVDGTLVKYYRHIHQYFDERPREAATVDDLGTFICTHGKLDVDNSRVKIRLHHCILPKLTEAGLLDYDARSNTVRYRAHSVVEKTNDLSVHSTDSEA